MIARTRREVIREFRHSQILDAARGVFAQRGFADASMDEIARSAGLAKGTLYLYYPSKLELCRASLREGLVALCRALEQEVDDAPDLARAIESDVVCQSGVSRRAPRLFSAPPRGARKRADRRGHRGFPRSVPLQMDLLERAIVEKAPAEKPRVAPRAVAAAIFDLTRGVVYRRLLGWNDSRAEEDARHVIDFAVGALGPR